MIEKKSIYFLNRFCLCKIDTEYVFDIIKIRNINKVSTTIKVCTEAAHFWEKQ